MVALDAESAEILAGIREDAVREGWDIKPLEEVAHACLGKMLDNNKNRGVARPYLRNLNVRWI